MQPVWATPNEGDVQGAINNSRVAEQMAMDYLADHNFQPVIAPTQPNVMTALNGTDHGWFYNNLEPGATQPWNSIFDELSAHGRSWKIYYALPTSILNGTIWDQIIPSGDTSDLTTGDQFFTDISNGTLPDFSFVRPGVGYSTEAPEDIGQGDAWVGQLVNAVAHSQYWDNTAIFLTYDEGGGFWDHVAPSYASGYGTRTPMVIISPYARKGVFHQPTTNVSILSLDSSVNGPVQLSLTPPAGVAVPSSFPASATLASGQANITVKFATAGYYRIKATGPGGSVGWVTVDVGVNPNTSP